MPIFPSSNTIKVFPASDRSADYRLSSLLTETNLTGPIKSLYQINNSSFVIPNIKIEGDMYTRYPSSFSGTFEFVIQGYYFSVDVTNLSVDRSTKIYANIVLPTTETLQSYRKLSNAENPSNNLESGNVFYGLEFTEGAPKSSPSSGYSVYSLCLWSGSVVPDDSKIKLDISQMYDSSNSNIKVKEKFVTHHIDVTTGGEYESAGKIEAESDIIAHGKLQAVNGLDVDHGAKIAGSIELSDGVAYLDTNSTAPNPNYDTWKYFNSIIMDDNDREGRTPTKKLFRVNLYSNDPDATAASGKTITYYDSIEQFNCGKLKKTRKTATISDGSSTQGTFGFNGTDNVKVKGLSTTDTPTFSTVKLTNINQGQEYKKKVLIVTNDTGQVQGFNYRTTASAGQILAQDDFLTEKGIYYGLPTINNSHNYTSDTNIYAPSAGGATGTVLIGNGTTSAPKWLAAGTSGYVLKSKGSADPEWVAQSAIVAGEAAKLSSGNVGSAKQPVYFSGGVPVAITNVDDCISNSYNAPSASKLSATDAGSTNNPVYFSGGVPVAVTSITSSLLPSSAQTVKGAIKSYVSNNVLYIDCN